MGLRMAAMIFAEVGAFSHFNSPDKQLACAGMSPSAYSSGQLKNCCTYMEKLGPRHLRCALYNTTKYVWRRVSVFAAYLAKNRTEGKHYHVAVSHTAKKLVRLIFAMEKFGMLYSSLACLLSDCRPGLRLPPATGVPVSPQYSKTLPYNCFRRSISTPTSGTPMKLSLSYKAGNTVSGSVGAASRVFSPASISTTSGTALRLSPYWKL